MKKRVKLVLALAVIAVTSVVFIARERGKARSRTGYESNIREARITFEDFTATRYLAGSVTDVARAKSGYLLEPNMLELFGDVSVRTLRGKGHRQRWEKLYCETATAYFQSSNLAQMVTSSAVDHVDLRGFVKLESKGMILESDSARYINATGILQSESQVKVTGPGIYFRGEGGFSFDLRKENLNVLGPVKGGVNFEMP